MFPLNNLVAMIQDDRQTIIFLKRFQMVIIRGVSNIFTTTMHLDNGLQMWRYFPSPKLKKFQEGYSIFKQACTNHIYQAIEELKVQFK